MKRFCLLYIFFLCVLGMSAQRDSLKISIDGAALEFFVPARDYYVYYLPHTAVAVPRVEASTGSAVRVRVKQAKRITGEGYGRKALIWVAGVSGSRTRTYIIEFVRLPKMDMFLALGQSNMAGRGYMTDADVEPMENVYLLTPSGKVEEAMNPMNKYSSVRKEMKMQRVSPSYTFALTVQSRIERPIGVMQNCLGGSSIQEWMPGSEKRLFEEAVRRAREAQRYGEIKAVIWHQGEANAKDMRYLEKLKVVVEALRRELGEPELYLVAGQIAQWRPSPFNEIITRINDVIPHTDWISSEGSGMLSDEKDPHFSAEGCRLLGERYAEKVLRRVYGQ